MEVGWKSGGGGAIFKAMYGIQRFGSPGNFISPGTAVAPSAGTVVRRGRPAPKHYFADFLRIFFGGRPTSPFIEGPRAKRAGSSFFAFSGEKLPKIHAKMRSQWASILCLRNDRFLGISRASRSAVEIRKKYGFPFFMIGDEPQDENPHFPGGARSAEVGRSRQESAEVGGARRSARARTWVELG